MSASQSAKIARTPRRRKEILLLEREQALGEIEELVSGAAAGNGAIAAIVGGAGEGKTALLSVARDIAERQGFDVLRARGSDLEAGFALGGVRQLLEPFVHALDSSERERLLDGAASSAANVLGFDANHAPSISAALHGLYWLLANMASATPILLAIDDAQWIDMASLEWLAYLRGRIDGLAVCAILATRPIDQEALSGPLHMLMSDPELRRLPVAALGKHSVARLIEQTLGVTPDERFASSAHQVSAGNPFVLSELLDELARTGVLPTAEVADGLGERAPGALAHNILARLARLSATAVEVARALAVLGDRATLREAAALACVDPQEAGDTVDMLAREGILDRRQTLGFAHPLIRTAVYEAIEARRRAQLHARAASILSGDGADPEAVAAHLMLADPAGDPHRVRSLRTAANIATQRGAPPAAVAYLARALAEPPAEPERAPVLSELAHAEMLIRSPEAIERLQAALAASLLPAERARLRASLSDALLFAGQWDRAREVLLDAVEDVRGSDPDLTLRLEGRLMTLGTLDGRAARGTSDEDLARLLASSRADLDGARPLRLNLALLLAVRGRPPEELMGLVEQGLDAGRFLERETADAIEAVHAAFVLVLVDRLEEALTLTEEMLADAARRGSVLGFLAGSTFRSLTYLRQGALMEAEADAFLTLETARELGLLFTIPFIAGYLALTLHERGRNDPAAELLDSIPLSPAIAGTPAGITLLEAKGRVHRARGQKAQAIADLRACGDACEALAVSNPNVVAWRSQLALTLSASDPEQALALVDRELELARVAGVARGIGVALSAKAAVGPSSEREALLSEAIAVLERGPARLELARALIDLGAHHRREGRRTTAREPLLRGQELAHRCHADRLLELSREELLAAGARPRRPWLTGIEALTPSELRVARMVATGRSNQEVAQTLFITTQTVKGHLSSVYRKLGISSRGELDAAFPQTGDATSPITR